jgi:hypothetical protein
MPNNQRDSPYIHNLNTILEQPKPSQKTPVYVTASRGYLTKQVSELQRKVSELEKELQYLKQNINNKQ